MFHIKLQSEMLVFEDAKLLLLGEIFYYNTIQCPYKNVPMLKESLSIFIGTPSLCLNKEKGKFYYVMTWEQFLGHSVDMILSPDDVVNY